MWKTKFLKLAYGLNNRLNLADIKFLSGLKRFGKRLMFKVLASNEQILVKIHGIPFYIHSTPASIQEYILQPFEPYTTELFKRAVKPGAIVIDIGAQFGYYSLLAAKFAGPEGKVFAFEPVPSNFKILKKNIQMNNYAHIIHPIQKAIGNKQGKVTLFLYERSDSHGMFPNLQATVKEAICVECITIDELFGEQSVDVIKMDIEGNEPYALQGMKKTVSRSNNLVLFTELAPTFLRKGGTKPEDYLAQLEKFGFDAQLIDENSRSLKPVTEDFLTTDDPSRHANLYCIRRKV
jgi:FkbM family methyltransferase